MGRQGSGSLPAMTKQDALTSSAEAMDFTQDDTPKTLHPGAPLEAVRCRRGSPDVEPHEPADCLLQPVLLPSIRNDGLPELGVNR